MNILLFVSLDTGALGYAGILICHYRVAKTHRMPQVEVIFRQRATNCRALLRKMTYEDKASYDSTPPCSGHSACDMFVRCAVLYCIVCIMVCAIACHRMYSIVRIRCNAIEKTIVYIRKWITQGNGIRWNTPDNGPKGMEYASGIEKIIVYTRTLIRQDNGVGLN